MVLKLFSPYGKITKLDFMFHWSGPKKGAPRGYCFLEFEKASQATDATKAMNRKVIKSRPLSVSLANVVGSPFPSLAIEKEALSTNVIRFFRHRLLRTRSTMEGNGCLIRIDRLPFRY